MNKARVAGTIYGQILATTVVATLSEGPGISSSGLFVWYVVTIVVFWLARVYAEEVAERVGRDSALTWADVVRVAARERAELAAGVPAGVVLALGWIGVLSGDAAVDLAIGLGILGLFGWGFVIARRSHLPAAATVTAVVINGAFGLAILALKIFIH
jgi:hypothetical protein